MADTLKFGPEWLRALSDGNTVASPPPTPGIGGKFKLANNRYGREEMLALFHDQYKAPDELKEIPSIYCEAIQKPLVFMNLSEEEQRLMSQSVNSVTVLRSMGRGSGPPTRGRGGSTADRGRGRGRGRGEYTHRTISENGEHNTHSGGFGVPGRNVNNDGWEEVGKKYERGGYISRNFDETTDRGGIKHFNRSLSNDNWREKNNNEEDDGSWRRAGTRDKWNKDSRGNWRDPNHDNQDNERKQSNGFSRDGPPGRQYQRSRSSESWDTEDNLPEWSTEIDDPETVGYFDASGAFVSTSKEPGGLEDELEERPDKENQVPSVSKEKFKENNNNDKTKEEPNQKSANSAKINSNNRPNGDPKLSNNKTDINPNNMRASPLQMSDRRGGNQNENSSRASPSLSQRPNMNNKSQHNNLSAPQKLSPSRSAPDLKAKEGEALDFMKLEAENLVAKVTDEDDFVPSMKESSSQQIPQQQPSSQETFKWLYKDPQGDIQGPFTSDEMAEWFSAGYFTMSLLVKRICDERFQQLGDLIKRWGRVPFLAGLAPPPLLNSPVTTLPTDQPAVIPPISQPPIQTSVTPPPNEQINVLQQQFMLQQQMLQQQLLMRQLQQQQQQQMVLQQMQEQEGFKSLPMAQQQQLMMQMMMSQPPMLLPQQQQQLQQQAAVAAQQQQRLSPLHTEQGGISNHPSFHRSMSQPSSKSDNQGGEETIWGGVNTTSAAPTPLGTGGFSQPTSVWDLEAGKQSDPADLHAQIQRMQEEMQRVKRLEEERKREEEIKQLELQRKQEEIKQQQEMLMREKQEIERQRQLELQKMEVATRQQQEEERKKAEEMMRQEQERQLLRLEEHRRRKEEARIEEELRRVEDQQRAEERRLEEERKKEDRKKEEERKREEKLLKEEAKRKMEEEKKRQQEILQQQELIRQQELQRQELEEQQRKQEEAERQAELQRQQQEALRKLQQQQREQLSNIKLPATAQWAKQQNGGNNITNSLSLTEIQQQEHQKWLEEEQQRQIELQQKQHMEMLQQKQQAQQQQQKSWASHVQSPASSRKSLMQIQQEEQAKLVETERKRQQQQTQQKQTQQKQAQSNKNVSLASAAAWAGPASNNTSSVWGGESGAAGGIWEQPPSSKKKAAAAVAKDFPALKDKKVGTAAIKATKTTNAKTTKEEVVVKSLFKPQQKSDEFTTWCENALKTIATSVDVPTFIAFLQDVESPYEVHDYVRSYLGETKAVNDFSKMYLEKRSQYRNKKRQEKRQQEDSIWGPAPAINPKERKPAQASDGGNAQKSKGKKKKKMQKLDGSVLGFTCQAAPDRVNAGEIENIL